MNGNLQPVLQDVVGPRLMKAKKKGKEKGGDERGEQTSCAHFFYSISRLIYGINGYLSSLGGTKRRRRTHVC